MKLFAAIAPTLPFAALGLGALIGLVLNTNARRWIRVTGTRVIESTDPVNYRWTADEGTVHVEAL